MQRTKLAVMEAEWETQEPPADFTLFGIPNQEEQRTDYAIRIPYVLGLIATRSIDEPVIGLKDILAENERRMRSGAYAVDALRKLRAGDRSPEVLAQFEAHKQDLGYGLLLSRYAPDPVNATEEQIQAAVAGSIPQVAPVFWLFRLMVFSGFTLLLLFVLAFYYCAKRVADQKRWLLRFALYALPLPWIAVEAGWIVAEYGRQPWAIGEVLPTALATSSLDKGDLLFSLSGFVFFYTLLFIAEIYLMLKYARLGPSSLHTGRYHHETQTQEARA